MALSKDVLNQIHTRGLATLGKKYYGDDEKIYIGIPQGRLKLLDTSNTIQTSTPNQTIQQALDNINNTSAEVAQDAVGSILTDTSDIDFTYNDITPSITADLTTTGVVAGTYGDATHTPTIVIDSKGRITSSNNTLISLLPSAITLTNNHILIGNASNIATDVLVSGDLTTSNTGVFTFNNVNSNIGTFNNVTVNAKGLVTAASNISYLTTINGISAGGELSGTYANPSLLNSAVIGKVLTGYISGAGIVSATDTILGAIQKLNGNIGSLVTGVSSVSGTTNRISVSPGTGAVVIDISSLYIGQATITTLGTITTGIWNGTAIGDTYISSASNWNTAYTNRITSLTTTGTSGAATLIANTLNIPQYQAAGTYVTSVTATSPITSSGGTTPTISTSMSTGKLIGRGTAGTGVMEEITLGTNISLTGTTLNVTTTAPTLTQNQVAFGDASNLITSSSALTFDGTTLQIGATPALKLTTLVGSTSNPAIYLKNATPNSTNYALASTSNGVNVQLNASTNLSLRLADTVRMSFGAASTNISDQDVFFQSIGILGDTTGLLIKVANSTLSSANLGVNGGRIRAGGGTITDGSGAGTRAVMASDSYAANTFASTNAVTVTQPTTLYIAGAPTAGTNMTFTNTATALWVAAGASRFDGDVKLNTAGNGLYVKEGSNATMGRATLVGGTVTVSTTKVKTTSEIFLTNNVNGGTLGSLSVSARVNNTSFTISSTNILDTSTISWIIIEPS